jgi:hypothetical protein
MMSTVTAVKITFDTHAYVRTLKSAGFSETQAEGLSDGLAVAMSQGVATHDDIVGLIGRFDASDTKADGVEKNLNAKIDGVEKNLNAKIDGVEKNLNAKIDGALDKAVVRLGMFMTALVTVAVAVLSLMIVHH